MIDKIYALKLVASATVSCAVIAFVYEPTVTVALIGVGGNVLVVCLGFLFTSRKIKELHVLINSRLTELLKETGVSSRAIGRAEGIRETEEKQAIKEQGKIEGKKES